MNGLSSLGAAPMAHGAPPLLHSSSLGSGAQWGSSMDGSNANQYLSHAVRMGHDSDSDSWQQQLLQSWVPYMYGFAACY